MGKHEPKKSKAFMRGQHKRHLRRLLTASPAALERQTESYLKLLRQQDALWGDTYNMDRLPERVKKFREDVAFAEARKHNNRLKRGK